MSDGPPGSLHLTVPGDRGKRRQDRPGDHILPPETEKERRRIRRAGAMLVAGVKGELAGMCDGLSISCARAWLLPGNR